MTIHPRLARSLEERFSTPTEALQPESDLEANRGAVAGGRGPG